jgi:hypothetical protein
MCWESDGYWTVLGSGKRTARKPHRCEAGCRINPGDRYHYWTGIWEGDFTTGKACDPCWKAARALGDACRIYEKWSDDPPIYELRDAYAEHLDHGELPRDVVPPNVVRRLQRHYRELKKRVAS